MDHAFSSIPARLSPIMQKHMPLMWEAMAQAYTREFSLAELTDIANFAKTPSGQHFSQRSASMMADPQVAKANTAYLAELHVASQQIQQEVAHDVADYVDKHPDVRARLKSNPSSAKDGGPAVSGRGVGQ